ncbi:MAG: hypothetical protein LBK68_02735 [Candidatus Margulisbacteria bacterium]|jgi:hypothetical protein|nr:hypothetical protein [Candidatus Margulisiibacteriota bacterium]
MEFLSVRELTTAPRETWEKLSREGELAITNNGKPTALLLNIPKGGFDATIKLVHQVKFMQLLHNAWAEAEARGGLTEAEIEAEIQAVRAEAKKKPKTKK